MHCTIRSILYILHYTYYKAIRRHQITREAPQKLSGDTRSHQEPPGDTRSHLRAVDNMFCIIGYAYFTYNTREHLLYTANNRISICVLMLYVILL